MHPYEMFGVECGEGWKDIYQPIIDFVTKYNELYNPDSVIEITQIKEKFGGLRVYWGGENVPQAVQNELTDMICKAENKAYCTCEICGSTERVGITVDGWYTTLCQKCIETAVREKGMRPRRWKCRDDMKVYEINKEETHEYIK